ncbi:MAG: imidazoleglycerol phosphate dehydratase HisB [Paracoccaceae bacterium]|jgi:imidazoleglycerol phosphate dehydratase HisB
MTPPIQTPRVVTRTRTTNETAITCRLDLDGSGQSTIDTGIGFFDHMLTAFAKHSSFDLELTCKGDLVIDDHHTVEDCALLLGEAFDEALTDRRGITRFGSAYAPLDEALARVVVDLSGRPWQEVNIDFRRESLGGMATENVVHVFQSLAMAGRLCLHVDVLRGENDHHKAEAAFKALALAMRQATQRNGSGEIPSTKGKL